MKPRPSNKTLWLLAFLLVSMPLIAGCWLGDESASRDSRPAGNASGRSAGATTSGSAPPPVGGGQSAPDNKIQIIDAPGQTPGLQFRGKKFKLVTQNDLVNQYIPVTQTLDNWQEMFVVRRFPELASPREAIENVVDNLIEQGTDKNLISVEEGGQPENELAVDFIIWTEDQSLTEFNVHVYRRIQGGMIANMYLMRGYGLEGHKTLAATVAASRELILQSVLDSQFPLFIQ